jgi:hypothetical protein
MLGAQHIQGTDYLYTLQGWLKGINSTGDSLAYDTGADADVPDVFGFSLHYYYGNSDYSLF